MSDSTLLQVKMEKIISMLYIMYNFTAFQTGTQNIVTFMFPHTHSTCNMFWFVILARMSIDDQVKFWLKWVSILDSIIVTQFLWGLSRDCLLTINPYHKGVSFGKLAGTGYKKAQ